MKRILKAVLFLLLISCKENTAENDIRKSEEGVNAQNLDTIPYSNQLLDSILLCGDYSYMNGYFTIPYNGCIYKPETINKIGNIEIYLMPKKKINENDIENEEKKINTLSINDLKNNYKIYLFIIDKKFLEYNKNMEVAYYPMFPHKQMVYMYSNKWEKINTLNILDENNAMYKKVKGDLLRSDLISDTVTLDGNYHVKTKVVSVESGDPIELDFYINVKQPEATLSIGSNNGMESYCEGAYNIQKDGDVFMLEYIGEGICTSDVNESVFVIKYENDKFYIRSKRFYDDKWIVLTKK